MNNKKNNIYYLPIFCNLEGKKVIVIGGGRVAQRKIELILPTKAKIVVIAQKVLDEIKDMANEGQIELFEREYKTGDLKGAWIVIAATDDPEVQQSIFNESEERGIFCNVVDKPEVCSFIVPSMVRRGDLCIAISTGGQSPGLSKHLRKNLEKEFGYEWEDFITIIGQLRRIIIKKFPKDIRKAKLERLVDLNCLEWIKEKRWNKVKKWAQDICEEKLKGLDKFFK